MMGMMKSNNAHIVESVFTYLVPRMSSSALNAEVSFSTVPGARLGSYDRDKGVDRDIT